jgi:broad specificity phosphatase PhoE
LSSFAQTTTLLKALLAKRHFCPGGGSSLRGGRAARYCYRRRLCRQQKNNFGNNTATTMDEDESENDDTSAGRKTFTLRPMEKRNSNPNAERYVTLHFLRHAEGTHNVSREYNDPMHKDARLTDFGKKQCAELAKAQPLVSSAKKITVATSPMTRCVQTASLCFDKESHAIKETIALEELRETVNYQCDIRRKTSELKEEFGEASAFNVDFSRLERDEEDPLWQYWIERCGSEEAHTKHRESASLYKCADRARKFFEWVEERATATAKEEEEEEIIVSSHSAFLRCMFNYGHTQEKFDYHMGGSEQVFDDRKDKTNNVKVIRYLPEDGDAFEEYMRRDYENCELRSAVLEIL